MIFIAGPFLLVRRARQSRCGGLLADARDADYRPTLFEFLREHHP
jgi:hypothetical protein